jgi:DNA-binding transcriptional ArsR family regulator
MQETSVERYEAAGELFKALASPVRLAIVDLLTGQPRYVHQLAELTGLTRPHVSQHLRILRHAGVVRGARRHREIAYTLRDDHIARMVRDALTHTAAGGDG